MNLPIEPPLPPMLAKIATEIPEDGEWLFEPKWDGFRAIVFRDGSELFIQSRDSRPLDRYFPELAEPLLRDLPERCVVDGEIVILGEHGVDFDALQLRLHPAASRIEKLSEETPASYVAFDLIALDHDDLRGEPQSVRRERLELCLDGVGDRECPVILTPTTRSIAQARTWFEDFEGAGVEGIIAKPVDLLYQPKKRVMLKIKHVRTIDCVLAGFRWHKNGPNELVGSLLLGLFDDEGRLQHVGVTSSFKMAYRRQLAEELEPLRERAVEGHPWESWAKAGAGARLPGGQSRWSQGKDLSWEPVRPERVLEVKYDTMQGGRFRHAATFLRWREDKSPDECHVDQVDVPARADLAGLFEAS